MARNGHWPYNRSAYRIPNHIPDNQVKRFRHELLSRKKEEDLEDYERKWLIDEKEETNKRSKS